MTKILNIAVDAMGGEGSPKKSIDGIIHHSKSTKNINYNIFGNEKEISELINGLINSFNLIPTGGIIAVVSFHSIEDRIVKFFFKHYSEQRNSSRYLPETEVPELSLIHI